MTTPLLDVGSIATGYGDIRVVWDVSLRAWPGRITVLLGRNGSGKTTTLRGIAGLNPLHAGTIEYDSQVLNGMKAHERVAAGIGYVQEGKRLFGAQSVEENLLLGGYVLRRSRVAVARELPATYELFPILYQRRHDPASSLSGGQQQMLAIAQVLVAKPKLLLLDEPSSGLAPAIVHELMSNVVALKESGLAILLVEQAVQAAVEVADHVTVLDVGKVVLDAPCSDIGSVERVRDAAMGQLPDAPTRPVEDG